MSDIEAKWSKSMGLDKDLSAVGFGMRTERYALVLDDLVVKYVGVSIIYISFSTLYHVPLNSKSRSNLAPPLRSQELKLSSQLFNKED